MNRLLTRRLLLGCLAWGGGAWSGCRDSVDQPAFKALDVTGADWGRRLALTDTEGVSRTLGDWQGKVVVLFFGFMHCPDVCPTALVTLTQMLQRLGPAAERVQGLMVTLDPERDQPELLARYLSAFDARLRGLYGDAAATAAAAREFKVFYQRVPGEQAGSYSLDHTAALYVLDPRGRLRLYVRHGTSADDLAADVRLLLAGR